MSFVLQPIHSSSQHVNFEDALIIWFNNVRSNHARVNDDMSIENAKHLRDKLKVTGFSHFVDKFDYKENLIIQNFSMEPKGLDY